MYCPDSLNCKISPKVANIDKIESLFFPFQSDFDMNKGNVLVITTNVREEDYILYLKGNACSFPLMPNSGHSSVLALSEL